MAVRNPGPSTIVSSTISKMLSVVISSTKILRSGLIKKPKKLKKQRKLKKSKRNPKKAVLKNRFQTQGLKLNLVNLNNERKVHQIET